MRVTIYWLAQNVAFKELHWALYSAKKDHPTTNPELVALVFCAQL
jgi:hypothetical protein